MDGTSAARALTRRARRPGGAPRVILSPAGRDDDPEIRALLREAALPGSVHLSFEREPDSFAAGRIEGDRHVILVARERESGRLAAVAARSSRVRFVNGRPARVAYLGGLRIAGGSGRSRELLDEGFALCRRIEDADPVEFCLASVVADHASARRRLERGGRGWPVFTALDELVTMAIPVRGLARRRPAGVEIVSGLEAGVPAVLDLLTRYNQGHQVAPCWTAADFDARSPIPGLCLDRVFVARRDGEGVACAALWDQRAVRQVVVRGYPPLVARWRAAINALGRLTGLPRLPPPGSRLDFAHVSHVAVADDDREVAAALLAAAGSAARRAGLEYLTLGLSTRNPLSGIVRRTCRHRSYRSVLYAGWWPDRQPAGHALDGRPSHPETAVL